MNRELQRVPFLPLQLRDFLLVYNRMTELCFQRCVSNLNYRTLAREEVRKACPLPRAWERERCVQAQPRASLHRSLCLSVCLSSLSLQEACLDSCAGKLVRSNHRLMAAYVQLMPALVQRRIADYETAASRVAPEAGPQGVPAAALPEPLGQVAASSFGTAHGGGSAAGS